MGGKMDSSASGVDGGIDPWSLSDRKPTAVEGSRAWMPSWPLDELECRVGAIVVSHSFPRRSMKDDGLVVDQTTFAGVSIPNYLTLKRSDLVRPCTPQGITTLQQRGVRDVGVTANDRGR